MKIPEQRTPLAVAVLHAKEIAIQRIGELAGAAGRIERICRTIEHWPVRLHEMLPGALVAGGASAREREIFEMQALQISRDVLRSGAFNARLQRGCELIERHGPAVRLRLAMQTFRDIRRDLFHT